MTKDEIKLNLKIVSDISDVKSNVEQLQKLITKLGTGVKPDLGVKFSNKFSDFFTEYERFIKLQSTPSKSNSQLKTMEQSGARLVKYYQELVPLIQKIDGANIALTGDPQKLEEYNQQLVKTKTNLNDAYNQEVNLVKALQELKTALSGSSGKISQAFNAAFKDDGSFDFDTIEKLLPQIKTYFGENRKLDASTQYKAVMKEIEALSQKAEIQALINQLKETENNITKENNSGNASASLNETATALTNTTAAAKEYVNQQVQMANAESEAAKNAEQLRNKLLMFVSATNAFNLLRRAITQTFNQVKELDEVMTEMAVVTTSTVGDYWEQLPEYTERAYELGVAIKDVYESMTLYYQQGLNTAQATDLSTATLRMARIANLDAEEATQRMTNALRGFNLELNDIQADRVADVYSNLAALSAADVDQISTAMTKVASIANSANMSLETTAALLTQIIETTQESAETAGTALKTVIARFSEVKTLYSTGELTGTDEEGEEIDVNNISKALRTAGINLNEYITGAKGLDDIFIELASKWDSLDTVTQKYIATMAAGSRQQSRFIAMMSNYTRTLELVDAAENASGASAEQFNKTLDSLESKLSQLQDQWQSLTTTILNSNVIKGVIDLATGYLKLMNDLTGHSWLGKITAVTLTWTALSKGIKLATNALTKYKLTANAIFTVNKAKAGGVVDTAELAGANKILMAQVPLRKQIWAWVKATKADVTETAEIEGLILNTKSGQVAINAEDLGYEKLMTKCNVELLDAIKIQSGLQEANLTRKGESVYLDQIALGLQKGMTLEEAQQNALAVTQNMTVSKSLVVKLATWACEKGIVTEDTKDLVINKAKEGSLISQLATLFGIKTATLGIMAVATAVVVGLAAWAAYLVKINSIDYKLEQLETTKEELSDIESELDEINSELESTQQEIETINNLENPTLTDEEELLKLKQSVALLKEQARLKELETQNKQKTIDEQSIEVLQKIQPNKLGTLSDITKESNYWESWLQIPDNIKSEYEYSFEKYYQAVSQYNQNTLLDDYETWLTTLQNMSTAAQNEYLNTDEGFKQVLDFIANGSADAETLYETYFGTDVNFNDFILESLDTNSQIIDGLDDKAKSFIEALQNRYGEAFTNWVEEIANVTTSSVIKVDTTTSTITTIRNLEALETKLNDFKEILDDFAETDSFDYQQFIDWIDDEDNNIDKTSQAYKDLTQAILDNNFDAAVAAWEELITTSTEYEAVLDSLNTDGSNQEQITNKLEEIGIMNAEEVVKSALIKKNIELGKSWKSLTKEQQEWFKIQGNWADITTAMEAYNFQVVIIQSGGLSDYIKDHAEAFNNYAKKINLATKSVTTLSKAMNLLESGSILTPAKLAAITGQSASAIRQYYTTQEERKDYLESWINKQLEQIQTEIDATISVGIEYDPDAASTDEKWENTYDKYYNNIARITELEHERNLLQSEYDNLLNQANVTSDQLLKNKEAELANLREQNTENQKLLDARKQQLQSYIASSGLQKYAGYENGQIKIDYGEINAVVSADVGEEIEEYISQIEEWADAIDELEESIQENITEQNELIQEAQNNLDEFREEVMDKYVAYQEKQIDALENAYDAIEEVNSSIIDNISSIIDENRKQRDRENTENELSEKRTRLAYLQQDTSGANALAIKQLQEEIEDAEQDYTDTLIDDKINQLEDQNDYAAEQREKQIQILNDQLEYEQQAGVLWEKIDGLISSGNEAEITKYYQSSEDYTSMSTADKLAWSQTFATAFQEALSNLKFVQENDGIVLKKFAQGGLADFTGPAWLDGNSSHPELILNAQDTQNFIQLKDALSKTIGQAGNSTSIGDAYYNFTIQVEQLANDYDVDKLIDRVKEKITSSSQYRNVNAINLMR